MKEIIFLEGCAKDKIWGGTKIKQMYNLDSKFEKIGEYWAVSANDEGMSHIASGTFKGRTLKEVWNGNRELFGSTDDAEFPLLVKILEANDDLSVQVHPGKKYNGVISSTAKSKTECWYVLDCSKDAEIIYGHTAASREEFREKVMRGAWQQLLSRKKIQKGDFIFVPSGTVHALTKGTLVLEIQENSDTTFRLYDYDRLENGTGRQLHINEAIDAASIPHENPCFEKEEQLKSGVKVVTLIRSEYFSIFNYFVDGSCTILQDKPFLIMFAVEGEGSIDGTSIRKGDFFILPGSYGDFTLTGKIEIIAAAKE